MFDLIAGRATHIPQRPALPIVASTTLQLILIAAVVAVPLLFMTEHAPQLPTIMAFVAAPPPPPPPPPPAPAPSRQRDAANTKPVPTTGAPPMPLAAPSRIEAEAAQAVDDGVPGGVEGGVPGGVVGGVVGGLPSEITPPPAAPEPPPPPRRPVRVGGQIEIPALLHRVEPAYPDYAVRARVQGLVILEAVVDERGRVSDITVLRSAHPVLDREAVAAVRQWRYRPLQLNDVPVTFVLTVTLSFSLESSEASE